jgi:hypothetical protein
MLLYLVSSFAQYNRHFDFLFAPEYGHFDGVTCAMSIHGLSEALLAVDSFAVDGDNKISANHDGSVTEISALGAAAQPGTIGGPSGHSLNNE